MMGYIDRWGRNVGRKRKLGAVVGETKGSLGMMHLFGGAVRCHVYGWYQLGKLQTTTPGEVRNPLEAESRTHYIAIRRSITQMSCNLYCLGRILCLVEFW